MAQKEPDNLRALISRANIHGVLSWVLHEQGDMPGFLANATACELHLSKALALEPDNQDAAHSLASAYARRGVYYMERDRSAESARLALEPLQKWTALAEQLSARSPDNATLDGELGESRSYLGLAYHRAHEPARAIDILRRSTEQLARRMQDNPRDVHLGYVLQNSRIALATVMLRQDDHAGAADQARLALALYDAWPEATRKSVMHLHAAAEAHFLAGQAAAGPASQPNRAAC
jgi:tetratricopeptide (TPR) repeat protein